MGLGSSRRNKAVFRQEFAENVENSRARQVGLGRRAEQPRTDGKNAHKTSIKRTRSLPVSPNKTTTNPSEFRKARRTLNLQQTIASSAIDGRAALGASCLRKGTGKVVSGALEDERLGPDSASKTSFVVVGHARLGIKSRADGLCVPRGMLPRERRSALRTPSL